jgi:hypothetical protein
MSAHELLVYAQHTVRAGQQCWNEDYSGDDVMVYRYASADDLEAYAAGAEALAAKTTGGNVVFWMRVARTLQDAAAAL